jgi:hypothetical protein
MAFPICLKLLIQLAVLAFSLALANTGNRIAAKMAIMAITTSSSISVKPPLFPFIAFVSHHPFMRVLFFALGLLLLNSPN